MHTAAIVAALYLAGCWFQPLRLPVPQDPGPRMAALKARSAALDQRIAASRARDAQIQVESAARDARIQQLLKEMLPLAHGAKAAEARRKAEAAKKTSPPAEK